MILIHLASRCTYLVLWKVWAQAAMRRNCMGKPTCPSDGLQVTHFTQIISHDIRFRITKNSDVHNRQVSLSYMMVDVLQDLLQMRPTK
jgi:hypothetical protein